MFIFIALTGLALVFMKLGALSVMTKVLSFGLMAAAFVLVMFALIWVVRRLFRKASA